MISFSSSSLMYSINLYLSEIFWSKLPSICSTASITTVSKKKNDRNTAKYNSFYTKLTCLLRSTFGPNISWAWCIIDSLVSASEIRESISIQHFPKSLFFPFSSSNSWNADGKQSYVLFKKFLHHLTILKAYLNESCSVSTPP